MTEIISVRFRPGGKQYYFDPAGLTVGEGQGVIVETGKGLEYGTCVRRNSMVEDASVVQPLRPVVRLATEKDEDQVRENRGKEKEALGVCQQLVERHGLDMKLVQVEYSFDGSKIIFFFTSDGRVDFRALVKDLAGIFRARIELRQIGVRDEARMLGGFGICGKPFCCAQFLDEFQPVSIKMAKTQNLSLNPTKISGTCGRLMCCLKYEQGAYEDAVKRCPKQESFVECPDGVGTVSSVNLLKEQVKVRLEDSTEQPKSYLTGEIRVVRSGKGKRPEGYTAPPKAELEQLRTQEGEQIRSGRKLEGPSDLGSALDRYLGDAAPQKQPEGQKQGGRRNRGHGGQGKSAQGQPPRQQAQPKQQTQPKQQAQPKPAPQREGQGGQSGEAKTNHKRRYRSHHRRKSGGGQAPQA
ncbi:MAG: stage 0 sporulation family protein [Clostridiales bacterium]|nr:stage 0 sporulation family protein [Clostridiales bacterium]